MKTIGEQIINEIIKSRLIAMHCPDSPESGCVGVWSANAAEQITELVKQSKRKKQHPEVD